MVNACVPNFLNELLISKCFFNIIVIVFENVFSISLLSYSKIHFSCSSFGISSRIFLPKFEKHILTQSASLFLAINSISQFSRTKQNICLAISLAETFKSFRLMRFRQNRTIISFSSISILTDRKCLE